MFKYLKILMMVILGTTNLLEGEEGAEEVEEALLVEEEILIEVEEDLYIIMKKKNKDLISIALLSLMRKNNFGLHHK